MKPLKQIGKALSIRVVGILIVLGVAAAIATASSATIAAGLVISESPVAGTSVAVGSGVSLVVSTGPAISAPTITCSGFTITLSNPGTTYFSVPCSATVN